ncbi:RNA-directed DNA polymerase mobile like protein [Argiope bruennichi]|uniref:RNA-directed DNA polymerase mobile like protein n=1 Tax=Argiope bruennichi TaxID=94029 RepID=A0A8T0E3Y2_ARGBR|nr:RNA-directed DNA polymerase mobile like protein [Argiope bruennichi]
MAAIDVDASFRSLEECFESLENVLNCVGNPSKKLREGARTALGKLKLHFIKVSNGSASIKHNDIHHDITASVKQPTYASAEAPSIVENEIHSMDNNVIVCSNDNNSTSEEVRKSEAQLTPIELQVGAAANAINLWRNLLYPRLSMNSFLSQTHLRVIQLNLHKSKCATQQLILNMESRNIDIALVQEPHSYKGTLPGFPSSYRVFYSQNSDLIKAAIIVRNRNISAFLDVNYLDYNMVTVHFNINKISYLFVSYYFEPSKNIDSDLQKINQLFSNVPINKLVWSMDANSKSETWFSPLSDSRGIKLTEFISAHNLFVINEDCGPTFCGSQGSSYIDVTVVGTDLLEDVSCWHLTTYDSLSDHKSFEFEKFQKRVELSGIALPCGTVTNSFEETINAVLSHSFPEDNENDDNDCHKKIRHDALLNTNVANDPPFTIHEIDSVIRKLKLKKSPGPDSIPNEVIKKLHEMHPDLFLKLFNSCLRLKIFPRCWKKARVILIPKNNDVCIPHLDNLRCISLLSTLGKCFERLIVNRLAWRLHKDNYFNKNQFGFMPQKCTEDALLNLNKFVLNGKKKNLHTILVFLDIKGAFDMPGGCYYGSIKGANIPGKYYYAVISSS